MTKPGQNIILKVMHFLLQNIHVCVSLEQVQRLIPLPLLEVVPGVPPYVVGLMNLAGKSIPVVDLCICLGVRRSDSYTINTPILLCDDGHRQVGFVVDEIIGMDHVDGTSLQMQQEFKKQDAIITGVIPLNTQLTLFLDLKQLMTMNLMKEKRKTHMDKQLMNVAKHHDKQ